MPLKAVFLDVGDTLLREVPSRSEIYAAAARRRGIEVDAAAMAAHMRAAHAEHPERVAGAYRYADRWFEAYVEHIFCRRLALARAELAALQAELFERFEDPATFVLLPGARELPRALRARGLAVGIISNWSARLPKLLERLGFAGAFDPLVCSALVELEKPDPAIFALACRRAGVAPQEALHAGDRPDRDGAARAAGLRAVIVGARAAADADELPRVTDLEALGRLVERLAA
jgi:REG-2-like HAD superfamily hydrolase